LVFWRLAERPIHCEVDSDEICGELAFLEREMSNASVLASEEVVEVDAIQATDLRQLFETFSGLSARFYCSMAVVLAMRLRETKILCDARDNLIWSKSSKRGVAFQCDFA
jgi:CRP-like cAMP-binding protein